MLIYSMLFDDVLTSQLLRTEHCKAWKEDWSHRGVERRKCGGKAWICSCKGNRTFTVCFFDAVSLLSTEITQQLWMSKLLARQVSTPHCEVFKLCPINKLIRFMMANRNNSFVVALDYWLFSNWTAQRKKLFACLPEGVKQVVCKRGMSLWWCFWIFLKQQIKDQCFQDHIKQKYLSNVFFDLLLRALWIRITTTNIRAMPLGYNLDKLGLREYGPNSASKHKQSFESLQTRWSATPQNHKIFRIITIQ